MERKCQCLMITSEAVDSNEKILNLIKKVALVYEPNIKTYFVPIYDPIVTFLKLRFPEIDRMCFEFNID